MFIAQKSTNLWLGNGFLFDSDDNNILEYLNLMNTKDNFLRLCLLRPRVSEADFLPQPAGGAAKFLYSGTS